MMARNMRGVCASSSRRCTDQIHHDPRGGRRVARRALRGQAGPWTAESSNQERSGSASSWAAPTCLVTKSEYTDSTRRFRGMVTRIPECAGTREVSYPKGFETISCIAFRAPSSGSFAGGSYGNHRGPDAALLKGSHLSVELTRLGTGLRAAFFFVWCAFWDDEIVVSVTRKWSICRT